MLRCTTCNSVYDDDQQYCDRDGTPLLDPTTFSPNQRLHKVKGLTAKIGIAGVGTVVLIALIAFGMVYVYNRRTAPPAPEGLPTPSPEKGEEVRQPAVDSTLKPSENRPGYMVIGLSASEQADAMREMERRNQAGHQTRVAYSSEWSDLSPGYYMVVYGTFDTMAEATAAADELKSRDIQAYVKYSGAPKAGGVMSTPEQEADRPHADPGAAAAPSPPPAAEQSGAATEEAIGEVMRLWEQHFAKCGDSYVSLGPGNRLRQLRGVSFIVSQRHRLTKADEGNGFEWGGQVKAKWNVWRRANSQGSGWVWEEWKDSPQSFTFDVTKRNSRWKVLNSLYEQKKIECPDLP